MRPQRWKVGCEHSSAWRDLTTINISCWDSSFSEWPLWLRKKFVTVITWLMFLWASSSDDRYSKIWFQILNQWDFMALACQLCYFTDSIYELHVRHCSRYFTSMILFDPHIVPRKSSFSHRDGYHFLFTPTSLSYSRKGLTFLWQEPDAPGRRCLDQRWIIDIG